MQISTVIKLFKKAEKVYSKTINLIKEKPENFWLFVSFNNVGYGICSLLRYSKIYEVFKYHYKNYTNGAYLYKTPMDCSSKKQVLNTLNFRLNFLRTEIVRLERLKNKGYTHL